MSPAGDARSLALLAVSGVLRHGRTLDDTFSRQELPTRERAFARLLAATVLRRLGQIDAALATRIDRRPGGRDAVVMDALRLGAAQLLFLDTPPYAAIDTTVALVRSQGSAGHAGLVNAVLRRLATTGRTELKADAGRANTPEWLWRRWEATYGAPTAAAIAAAHLVEPPLDLTPRADAAAWAPRLDARILATGSLRRPPGGPIDALPGYAECAWWVQDAAAALPAPLLAPAPGDRVLDLCAAPGGKTMQLAAAGAAVTAVDRSTARLATLAANLARCRLHAELVEADAATYRAEAGFAKVLLDAPCSGTGTIRRHPDLPYRKSVADLARLTPVQDRLLDAALALTAPGGTLVYSVCSLEPEEGPERIAALLGRSARAVRRPIAAAEVGGIAEAITADGDLRTLPCQLAAEGGWDGFYACRLKRL